jgi:Skp family chaperone for outer membrane proteins
MTGRKLALGVAWGAAICLLGAQAVKNFEPPRTAVVDIAAVFDAYRKKVDLQAQLEVDTTTLEGQLKGLEDKYEEILAELKIVKPGSDRESELQFEKFKIEREVKGLRQNELKKLHEKRVAFLKEIQGEIAKEIQAYFEANDLDLVIEKGVKAEGNGSVPRFEWPIVHAVKPELEITDEIARRLNARYDQQGAGESSATQKQP